MKIINKRLINALGLLLFALVVLPANMGRVAAQPNLQFPTGLVSWWPAEGNALDVVGPNNGTLLGATFAPGKIGQAFGFDGVDDTIDLGPNNNIGSGNMPFTVAMWMYPTSNIPLGNYYFTIRLKQDTKFLLAFTNGFHTPGQYVVATFRDSSNYWVKGAHPSSTNIQSTLDFAWA